MSAALLTTTGFAARLYHGCCDPRPSRVPSAQKCENMYVCSETAITGDIRCLLNAEFSYEKVAIFVFGRGLATLEDIFPLHYYYAENNNVILLKTNYNKVGIRLSLTKDGEIAIINQERKILARVGFFCRLSEHPNNFCYLY